MTTIITRLYADADTAQRAASAVQAARLSRRDVDVIAQSSGGAPTMERMRSAKVSRTTAEAFAPRVDQGAALVVVRAGFNPRGAALISKRILDEHEPVEAGDDVYIRHEPKRELALSILEDHPRFLSKDMEPGRRPRTGPTSHIFGTRLLLEHRERRSAIHNGKPITTMFVPAPLILAHRTKRSAIEGGMLISKMFGLKLLSGWHTA